MVKTECYRILSFKLFNVRHKSYILKKNNYFDGFLSDTKLVRNAVIIILHIYF